MSTESSNSNMPTLPLGYHFTISFCEVLCNKEQLEAIGNELIDVAKNIIYNHNLRDESGQFIYTRLSLNRTMPLRDEQLPTQEYGVAEEL